MSFDRVDAGNPAESALQIVSRLFNHTSFTQVGVLPHSVSLITHISHRQEFSIILSL